MTHSNIDPERLAALLDGRLDEHARDDVLRQLDADPELRAMYADVAAVESELTSTATGASTASAPSDAHVLPIRPRAATDVAPSHWRSGRVVLMAASFVGITFLTWNAATSRSDARADGTEPYALVRQLGVDGTVSLPAEPWTVTRGTAAPVSERGRAVRLGARLVDLEVAIAAGDSGALAAAASSVVALANMDPPLTGAPLELYRRIEAGDVEAVRDTGARREGWDAMSELAGDETMRLGAWLEAARVATAQRDAAFFRRPGTLAALNVADSDAPPEERTTRSTVRNAMPSDGIPDWAELEKALREALQVAGR